jgi:hypothetical protein
MIICTESQTIRDNLGGISYIRVKNPHYLIPLLVQGIECHHNWRMKGGFTK